MSDLKPCPFCGHRRPRTAVHLDMIYVVCRDCGAMSPMCADEATAIAAWNRRAESEPLFSGGVNGAALEQTLDRVLGEGDSPQDMAALIRQCQEKAVRARNAERVAREVGMYSAAAVYGCMASQNDRFAAQLAGFPLPDDLDRAPATFDLIAHLSRQRAFSLRAFGPGARAAGIVQHIRKEVAEIEADPTDLMEWVDVVLLALDGAWRAGHQPWAIASAIAQKQATNEARTWPDWRAASPDQAIEHVRETRP